MKYSCFSYAAMPTDSVSWEYACVHSLTTKLISWLYLSHMLIILLLCLFIIEDIKSQIIELENLLHVCSIASIFSLSGSALCLLHPSSSFSSDADKKAST